MNDKHSLRSFYRYVRKSITEHEKRKFDERIFTRFINSEFLDRYSSFLLYVSVNDEADTINIIKYLLITGKQVAVPYCSGKDMFFCKIGSLSELTNGLYGIPTVKNPVYLSEEQIADSLCVVPALSIDPNGNRLGYGGGYYDRFLADNNIATVALCYERCISNSLITDKYDIPVKYVLTENKLKKL